MAYPRERKEKAMWRSMIQIKCNSGHWNSPFGEWYGEPADPFWYKPVLKDDEFLNQAKSFGIEVKTRASDPENFPGYLNWMEGDPWFALDLETLDSCPFIDPNHQLNEVSKLLNEIAEDAGVGRDRIRLIMYETSLF